MADTASLTLVHAFTYRGNIEEWATTHHLDNVPASASVWDALAQAVRTWEETFLTSDTKYHWAFGHEPGNPAAVFTHDWTASPPSGTWTPAATDYQAPGDCAMTLRWSTTQRNSLGKPIFLRNYFHDVYHEGASANDSVAPTQLAALQAFGNTFCTSGITAGGQTFKRAGPNGAVGQSALANPFVTTRTLRARGRRRRQYPAGTTVQLPPLVIN